MKNPTGKKLEKLVFGIFDQMVEGADKYVTKQGSTWLIFTESRKWVIEFTKDKTLWFNYNVFQNELDLIGKDCTEERDLIKDWFESRFLNKPKVEETKKRRLCPSPLVEDTIQNGVKESHHVDVMKFFDKKMENTIENGVKETYHFQTEIPNQVEDAIQEGVKRTFDMEFRNQLSVEDTIQEGVKHTDTIQRHRSIPVKDTIQNGVKYTWVHSDGNEISVEDTIQNGVKETRTFNSPPIKSIEDTIQNGVKETQTRMWPPVGAVEDTIQNGVKDIDYLEGLPMEHVEYTIQNGVKQTSHSEDEDLDDVEDTIENGVKHTIDIEHRNKFIIEDTIQNGVKHTNYGYDREESYIEDAIENGVKETQMMGNNREIIVAENIYDEKKNTIIHKTTVFDIVDDIVQNGVKLVDSSTQIDGSCVIEDVIQEGVKVAKDILEFSNPDFEDAIQNGVKEIKTPGEDGDLLGFLDFMSDNNTDSVPQLIEDTIQNGVKDTLLAKTDRLVGIEDTIENGVKETKEDRLFRTIHVMNTIKNGVKETKESMLESSEQIDHQVTNCEITENINDAIENGVKETKEISNISLMSEMFKVNAKRAMRDGVKELKVWKSNRCEEHGYFEFVDGIPTYTPMTQVKDVLENGVKEIQPLPAQDGNRDWGLYYHRQEDRTKPHTEYVKEVIEDSYNHRGRVEGVIRNTDKDGIR